MKKIITKGEDLFVLIFGLGVLISLYLMSLYHYLLFHTFAELFSIVIASAIFLVAWHTRSIAGNNYLLFIGIAYVFIAFIDTLHTLAYTGMGIIKGYGTNLPTQLWITGRYFESITLLIAPVFISKKLNTRLCLIIYASLTALILASIFYWQVFPDCFIEGKGLTPFKIVSEYVISFILVVSMLIINKQDILDKGLRKLIIGSIIAMIMSELAFTFYIHAYGFSNLVGHYLKIISFYLLYKAILVFCLEKPYKTLFKDLHQSEERFRGVVEDQTELICRWKPDGIITFVNEAYCDYFNKKQDELVGHSFMPFIPEKDIDKVQKHFKSLGRERMVATHEHRVIMPDGNKRWQQWTNRVIFDKNNTIVEYQSVGRDITRLKVAEEVLMMHSEKLKELVSKRTTDLVKSESRLKEAQKIAHLGNWHWDIITNKLQWSDEIYRIFGLEPQQFGATYEAFLNCVHPDDKEFVTESVNKALEENKPYSIDHRIVWPDGSGRIVHEDAKVFKGDTGKPVRMIGTVQDITEREKVKEQLQKNYETLTVVNSVLDYSLKDISIDDLLRHLIEQIVTITSFSFESKGCIFAVEGDPEHLVMKAQFGLDEQTKNLCKELPIGKCLCGKAAREKKVQFVEHVDERHEIQYDGMSDHGHYCIPILFCEKVLGVINVYTQKGHLYNKQEEEFLTTISNTLAGIIVRRYTEREKLVLEDKLRQSQQMRMLGQLTSGVAHEVRNPLNSIIAITEALFKEIGEDTEFQEYLEHIRKQVDRLSNLMQDLLDFGRPGKKSDLQPISIGSAVFETVNSWKHVPVYKKHKVRIIESPDIKKWYINADKNKIQQVLYNLIDNACDHSPEEQDILITMDRGEDSNVLVKVIDKGGGVSTEHLPDIFDPFFTTRKHGTGLGLSIVKNIIEFHGGNIAAYNNDPSPGLTVEVSLPLINKNGDNG